MNRLFILLIACALILPVYGQEIEPVNPDPGSVPVPEVPEVPDTIDETEIPAPEAPPVGDTIRVMDSVEVIETPEQTRVTLGQNEVLIIEENGDTVRIKLGSKGISIVEGDEGTEVKIIEMDEEDDDRPATEFKSNRKKKFKPHYAGIELGLNNYLTPDLNMNLPQDQLYMDLNTGRSWNFNVNFLEYGLGLGTDKVGLVTGLGVEWTNYVFDNQNSISKNENGAIAEYVPDNSGNIVRSKFNMTYLTAPLLLEFQIPAGKKRIHLSGGLIGGVKIGSNTKIKYEISGQKSKEKSKGDFNLAPLRYGATVRLGYRAINLYANYYLMPLFGENGGPDLHPFSIGLCLIPF